MSSVKDAWKELSKYSSVVPVLGTGFRRWVLGAFAPEPMVSWTHLIGLIAECAGLHQYAIQGTSLSSEYERIVKQATPPGHQIDEIENQILQSLSDQMGAMVAELRAIPSVTSKIEEFHVQQYDHVLDLNIDRLLAEQRQPQSNQIGYVRYRRANGRTSVWHPHGLLGSRFQNETIVLGMQKYGRAVAAVTKAFDTQTEILAGGDIPKTVRHWLSPVLQRPIVLLGVGLGPDEWDLWWFLHVRERFFAGRPVTEIPPVFRLTCAQDRHRNGASAFAPISQIIPLDGGKTWDEAWEKYLTEVNPRRRARP
jgi:hypothetical protein